MARKEVWISSHITQEEGLVYLASCIESLKCLDPDVVVVISYSGIMIELLNKMIAYCHFKQLSQFQHIEYIFNQIKELLDDNDLILFLDDDDILLERSNIKYDGSISYMKSRDKLDVEYTFSSPFDEILSDPSISGLIGLQILGRSKEGEDWSSIKVNEIPEFCISHKQELVDDFSGTVIRKQYLERFLSEFRIKETPFISIEYQEILEFCNKYIENTIDTKFMDFIIEKLPNGNISSSPTVFHRIKSYKSEWR